MARQGRTIGRGGKRIEGPINVIKGNRDWKHGEELMLRFDNNTYEWRFSVGEGIAGTYWAYGVGDLVRIAQ